MWTHTGGPDDNATFFCEGISALCYVHNKNGSFNFTQSESYCNGLGGNLAKFDSGGQQMLVRRSLPACLMLQGIRGPASSAQFVQVLPSSTSVLCWPSWHRSSRWHSSRLGAALLHCCTLHAAACAAMCSTGVLPVLCCRCQTTAQSQHLNPSILKAKTAAPLKRGYMFLAAAGGDVLQHADRLLDRPEADKLSTAVHLHKR